MTAAAPAGKSSSNATRLRTERAAEKNGTASSTVVSLMPIALDSIAPSPLNPRKVFDQEALEDLAASIRAVGVLQPILVRHDGTVGDGPQYSIVAGERRWRAAKLAGLTHIPAVMLDAGGSTAALEASITENHQRVPLSPTDLAEAVAALLDAGYSQAQAAERLGLRGGQPAVSRLVKVRELPAEVRALIAEHQMDTAHAHALARWSDFPSFVSVLAQVAVATDPPMSARELARPFEYDQVLDDERLTDLYESVSTWGGVFERANCRECPWKAFVETGTNGGWCLRPAHYQEVEAAIAAERRQPRPSQTQQGIGSAVEAAIAAARAPADDRQGWVTVAGVAKAVPAPLPPLEVGDRVRHNTLGEGSILEAKPHAVLIKPDNGGKEFWTGLNAFGGGKIELLDADGHATSHTPEVAAAPKVPLLSEIGYQGYERIDKRSPSPCRAAECTCLGKAREYGGGEVVKICTQPNHYRSLVAQATRARNAENRRRHVEAVSRLEDRVRAVADVGVKELVVLCAALADQSNGYRPAEARFTASLADSAGWLASKGSLDLIKADLAGGRLPNIRKALDAIDGQETVCSLTCTLVEAICRQDLAMRFHPEGGASYGALADWYVGEKLPQRTPDDWQPAVEPAKKAKAK